MTGPTGPTGPTGAQGPTGKVPYPAGAYNSSTTYKATATTKPYVIYNDKYYTLKDSVGTTGVKNKTPSSSSSYWEEFSSFEAIYAKIALIDNGTVGGAVFNSDYMFSKKGITASNTTTTAYNGFSSSNPYATTNSFRPNFCINFNDGSLVAGAGKLKINSDGSLVACNGNITFGADGTMTACSGNIKFEANKATFNLANTQFSGNLNVGGFVKPTRTTINDSNYSNYTTTVKVGTNGSNVDELSLAKTGPYVYFTRSSNTTVNMPGYANNQMTVKNIMMPTEKYSDDMRGYIGMNVLLYNRGNGTITVKFYNASASATSFTVTKNTFAKLICYLTTISGNEHIYWAKSTTGNITILNPNSV
jgi:hypothetical protein